MHIFLQKIIDYIFPPSTEELHLRDISPEYLLKNGAKACNTEFPFIKAIFSYKDPIIKELIWQIKYKKNTHTIKCAGYALYKTLIKTCFDKNSIDYSKNTDKIILIPIPISKKRRKERGYNQCELIIDEIAKLDIDSRFIYGYKLLVREKDIEKQTFKNRNERIINTKHIFKVLKYPNSKITTNNQILKPESKIIIIDDVTTTGSTLKEARDELLRVGYKNVIGLTIAH
jgi:competence protein ComFC